MFSTFVPSAHRPPPPPTFPLSVYIASDLLELADVHRCYHFVVYSEEEPLVPLILVSSRVCFLSSLASRTDRPFFLLIDLAPQPFSPNHSRLDDLFEQRSFPSGESHVPDESFVAFPVRSTSSLLHPPPSPSSSLTLILLLSSPPTSHLSSLLPNSLPPSFDAAEPLHYPSSICTKLANELESSHAAYPGRSGDGMMGLKGGWLERW